MKSYGYAEDKYKKKKDAKKNFVSKPKKKCIKSKPT